MIKLEITANSVEEYKEILGELVGGKIAPTAVSEVVTDKAKAPKDKQKDKEKEIPVAEKTLYFLHDGTGEVFKVEKGEKLDFLGGSEIIDLSSKKAYDAYLKSLDDEEPKESDGGEKATVSEEGPTKDELTNLIKSCLDKGLRKEVIAAFDQFGAKKFPQVEESDYAALKEILEELLA